MTVKSESKEKSTTWDIEKIYATPEIWEKAYQEMVKKPVPTGIKNGDLEKTLDDYFALSRELEKLYTYAYLKRDEDLTNHFFKELYEKINTYYHDFSHKTAWIEPAILEGGGESKKYAFYLKKVRDQKEHILSVDKEEILALAGHVQSVPQKTFSLFNNADLKFPKILNGEGNEEDLTHALYLKHMKSTDRTLRENAFKTVHNSFHRFENMVTELINGQVQSHIFTQKVRGYKDCLTAALKPHNIPTDVYHALIGAAREGLPVLHEYVKKRKEILGLKELHYWDLMVPLVQDCDRAFSYEEAVDIVVDSVALLGEEYQEILRKGLKEDRWVDVYESAGKRSGAYSGGSFDTMPYILLNYQGTITDVLTLSHEAGHSMHSYLSRKHQPYHYAHYPIFLAEIASTFHERLTYEYMGDSVYFANQQIEGIRTTFFRQAMFAEFELLIHELLEKGVALTPHRLKEEYRRLNVEYFGPDLIIDEELSFEYMRIPHFYYNFYVYQYATGIAAAYTFVDQVKKEGPKRYIEFLSSGGSDYPTEILKKAGLDICKKESLAGLIPVWKNLLAKNLSKS